MTAQHEKSFRLPNLFPSHGARYNVASGIEFDSQTGAPITHQPPTTYNIPTDNGATSNGANLINNPTSTPSGSSGVSEAERARLSNVERFWAEEQARKGKPRVHIGVGAAAKAKKKQAYFQAPADPNHAKVMWEKMKMELDHKWEKFQDKTNPSTHPQGANLHANNIGSTQSSQSREEKEEAHSFKKQPNYGPANVHNSSQSHGVKDRSTNCSNSSNGSSTYRGTNDENHPTVAGGIGTDIGSSHTSMPNRRSTAYAFTNIRKDDLKQEPKNANGSYQYSYATAGRDSTSAHTNRPAPPSYSYQPHPPSNPHPQSNSHSTSSASASTSTSSSSSASAASNPHREHSHFNLHKHGAQFSSFSRPPQPHHQPASSYFNPPPSSNSHSSSANGANLNSNSNSNSSYPSTHHSVPSSHPHSGLFDMFSRWSVKELKRELLTYGVTAVELNRLVEKDEFVAKCVRVHVEADRKAELKRQAEAKEAEKANLKEAIIDEVDRWAKGRTIKSMLNELNGCTTHEATGYLKRSDGLKEVSKSYKRALLKIHPDKHMDNESKHLRATEVFKYVSQAFNEYKKKHEPL